MLVRWLGLPRLHGAHGFIVALLIDALGTGLFLPFSLLYFTVAAGIPLPVVGATLTIATFCTLVATPVTGVLVDRVGARRIVVASQILQALGFLGYLAVRGAPTLFAMALLVTAGSRVFYAAFPSLVARIAEPGDHDRWFGLMGATQNLGLGAGGVLAGVVVALGGTAGYRAIVAINAVSFLIAAIFLSWRVREPAQIAAVAPVLGSPRMATDRATGDELERGGTTESGTELRVWWGSAYRPLLRDRPFLGMVAGNVAFALCALMLVTALPVYAINGLGAPAWLVGPAFALNTLIIVLTQTAVVRLMEGRRRTRAIIAAGLIWTISCGLFVLAMAVPRALLVPYLLGVVAVYTLGALLHTPISTALAASAGPAHLQGRYVAAYEFSWGLAAALAPGLFALLYARQPALPWIVVGILVLGAALLVYRVESRLPDVAVRASPRRDAGNSAAEGR